MTMYNTFPISVSMTAESLVKLEQLATRQMTSRSKVVRDLIDAADRLLDYATDSDSHAPEEAT